MPSTKSGRFGAYWKYPLSKAGAFSLKTGWRLVWTGIVLGPVGIGIFWRSKVDA